MQDMSWLHNPSLKNIHPKKMEIISELIEKVEGKPIMQTLPVLMQANKKLQAEGLSFTEDETGLIMDILTKDMTVQEKAQIEKMKGIIAMQMRK